MTKVVFRVMFTIILMFILATTKSDDKSGVFHSDRRPEASDPAFFFLVPASPSYPY